MKPSIFVSVANYRDSECQHTINDLYVKASGTYHINVGVCWQLAIDDYETIPESLRLYNLRNLYVNHNESEGCCWVRNRIYNELYSGETYLLCIDSHSRFVKHWDAILVGMLKKLNKKSVISTYPNSYEPPDTILNTIPYAIQAHGINSRGLPLLSPINCSNVIKENYFVAGGFIFSYGNLLANVPYDPYLYFFGEEITLSARLFSQGYTIYNPGKVLLYHYYTRNNSPKHWNDNNISMRNDQSIKRALHIMGIEYCSDDECLKEIEKYGIGNERTVQEYKDLIKYNSLKVMQ